MRITRTYLAVPAHQEKLVTSAARSDADAVFLDLEDAVPETMKAAALGAAVRAINELDWGDKVVVVRVNGTGPRQLELMGITVYRVDSPEDAAELIDAGLVSAFDAGQRVAILLSQSLIGRKKWVR